jgi:glycerol-3-phosphate dehydrogenase
MNRADLIDVMAAHPVFDMVIVGGGATGLGVALDAALRGFSVALFESHDFASGTSSRSTKLLHGGVRYLAQGNVGLVREALFERTTVLKLAPHLAQPLPFVMPSFAWWQTPFYGAGLTLYDLMARRSGLGRTRFLSRAQTLRALPGVSSQGLRGGVQYWDGQFDDARLALALARTAEVAGAKVLNHAVVASIRPPVAPGGTSTISVADGMSSRQWDVRARCVVNATGVWVDGLRGQYASGGAATSPMVRPSQGVHLVVDRKFLDGDHALLVPKTQDGRVLFAVPWLGKLVLGTTDTPRQDLPREPMPFAEEVDFILSEASRVLKTPVLREDVRSVWVGLRPLVAPPDAKEGATKVLSREHTVVVDAAGLVTVTGGKWTTYRAMAEDVLERCFESGLLPARPSGQTAAHALFGAVVDEAHARVPLHSAPGLHLYGSAAAEVRACPGADRHLGMGLTEGMVRYAVRAEYAQTVEDVLARRWRALFLDAKQAEHMAGDVADILRSEGISHPDESSFMSLCRQYQTLPCQKDA